MTLTFGAETVTSLTEALISQIRCCNSENIGKKHGNSNLLEFCKKILQSDLRQSPITDTQALYCVNKLISNLGEVNQLACKKLVKAYLAQQNETALKAVYFLSLVANKPAVSSTNVVPLGANISVKKANITDAVKQSCGKVENGQTENAFMKEVLYALQGINGSIIKFDQLRNTAIVDKTLPPGVFSMLCDLSKYGAAYQRSLIFLQSYKYNTSIGNVFQTFCQFVQQVISDYQYQLVLLEDRTIHDSMSLQDIFVSISHNGKSILMIDECIAACLGQNVAAILSYLFTHRLFDGKQQSKDTNNIFLGCFQEYLTYVYDWMFNGTIQDMYGEFFIYHSNDNDWEAAFSSNSALLPSVIDIELAKKIFMSGKILHFFKSEISSQAEFYSIKSHLLEKLSQLSGFSCTSFQLLLTDSISCYYHQLQRLVLKLFFHRFQLCVHFENLKNIMLLCQGNLADSLMENLQDSLNRPAQSLLRQNLIGLVESSIKAHGPHEAQSTLLKAIDIRLLRAAAGELGNDVFCLDYKIEFPVNVIVSALQMKDYAKCFSFLWKLRSSRKQLEDIYNFLRESTSNTDVKIKKLRLFLYFTIQLAKVILDQLVYAPISESWRLFEQNIQSSSTLEDISSIHAQFLADSMKNLLKLQQQHINDMFSQLIVLLNRVVSEQIYAEHDIKQMGDLVNTGISRLNTHFSLELPFF